MRVVGGALIEDGHMLVAQRGPGRAHAGLWELPGGKVEPGEQDKEALVREWIEELDLWIVPEEHLITITVDEVPTALTFVVYRCSRVKGEPVAREHSEIKWLKPNELQSLDWAPADHPLVNYLADAIREHTSPPDSPAED
jgi:8-oxo-dGTP diphosphatase